MKDSNQEMQRLKEAYIDKKMSRQQVKRMKQKIEVAKAENRRRRRRCTMRNAVGIAAAFTVAFVALPNTSLGVARAMENIPLLGRLVEVVTFRDYSYESDRNIAQVEVPEIIVDGPETDEAVVTDDIQEKLKRTTEEINAEIQEISAKIVEEFEKNLEFEEGYQDILVKSEVLCSTEDYFSLKLLCYQGAGSGAEWDYFYTIDLNTGKRLFLTDLFSGETDYITLVSENIKEQMREQMAADEMKTYWVDYTKIPEWSFESITEETSFYLNENNELVICFDEGEVAPMYMGCVEFVIPDAVLEAAGKKF